MTHLTVVEPPDTKWPASRDPARVDETGARGLDSGSLALARLDQRPYG